MNGAVPISVVLPATNTPPTLGIARGAIESQLEAADELLVVDSASGPGPAVARNEGAAKASGEVLLFVDADIVLAPGALELVRSAFAADPALVALFGSYDDHPPAPGITSRFRNLLHHHTHHAGAGEIESFWAGIGAVRRSDFDAVGGFDPVRFERPSIEDIELGGRLAERGRIVLDPTIQGTHLKHWSTAAMVRTDLFDRGVPWLELALERGELPTTLNLGWRNRLTALAAGAAAMALPVRMWKSVALSVGAVVALNAGLYRVLADRLGVAGALASVPLHVLHLWTALAAIPLALARHILRGRGR